LVVKSTNWADLSPRNGSADRPAQCRRTGLARVFTGINMRATTRVTMLWLCGPHAILPGCPRSFIALVRLRRVRDQHEHRALIMLNCGWPPHSAAKREWSRLAWRDAAEKERAPVGPGAQCPFKGACQWAGLADLLRALLSIHSTTSSKYQATRHRPSITRSGNSPAASRRATGLADPKFKARLADVGVTVLAGSPAQFGKLIVDETNGAR
jgi:hypothetical protein